jgi:hypothetical protein
MNSSDNKLNQVLTTATNKPLGKMGADESRVSTLFFNLDSYPA